MTGSASTSASGRTAMAAEPRVALCVARFYGELAEALEDSARAALGEAGVETIEAYSVPGAFELPVIAKFAAESGRFDAVVCLGAVIRGDTGHYDFVAGECAAGIQRVQLDTGTPVIFGVLTTDTVEQALVRSEPDETNKGWEAALAAIEMVSLLAGLETPGWLEEPGD